MNKSNRLEIYSAMAGINLRGLIENHVRSASNGHTKYTPHQGSKEQQRRLRQMERASK